MRKLLFTIIILNMFFFSITKAKQPRVLTLSESLNLALNMSYDIKYAEQNLIREQENVKAARAALRSNASINFLVPSFKTENEQVYDSDEDVFKYIPYDSDPEAEDFHGDEETGEDQAEPCPDRLQPRYAQPFLPDLVGGRQQGACSKPSGQKCHPGQ